MLVARFSPCPRNIHKVSQQITRALCFAAQQKCTPQRRNALAVHSRNLGTVLLAAFQVHSPVVPSTTKESPKHGGHLGRAATRPERQLRPESMWRGYRFFPEVHSGPPRSTQPSPSPARRPQSHMMPRLPVGKKSRLESEVWQRCGSLTEKSHTVARGDVPSLRNKSPDRRSRDTALGALLSRMRYGRRCSLWPPHAHTQPQPSVQNRVSLGR